MHVQFPSATRDDVFRLETRRLWLRWPRPGDADALQGVASPASVAEMTATWPHPLPEGEAMRRIASIRDSNAGGGGLALALTYKIAPDRLIGMLGCNGLASEAAGLGYFLSSELHGQGLMTEALGGLIDFLFTYTRLPTVNASSRIINPASAQVLVKCGFVVQGRQMMTTPARGGRFEVDQWRLTRGVWLAAAPITCLRRHIESEAA